MKYMEKESLDRVAQRYRDEGYEVVVEPRGDALPSFLDDFQVDLIARRGNEGVVVEIKYKRNDLSADENVSRMAEVVNRQPGWRLDVIVLERETSLDKAVYTAAEPSDEQIGSMIVVAEEMAANGHLPYAYVAALSSLEAVMRSICKNTELYPHNTTIDCLRNIYGLDLLSRDQFVWLRDAFKVRSQIVHGLVPRTIARESIHFVTAISKYLLYGIEATGPPPAPPLE